MAQMLPQPGWLATGFVVAALLAVAAHEYRSRATRQVSLPDYPKVTRSAALQHCTEGAMLFHDVRWAAACMYQAEQDAQADGGPDCDLPPQKAARLYELLKEAELKCVAEAQGVR
ncbi:MAG: hypothetical protein HY854_24760 [Burkholderiales bacterium]|nr:hypothetical protein [Burkholderiales bacterium]